MKKYLLENYKVINALGKEMILQINLYYKHNAGFYYKIEFPALLNELQNYPLKETHILWISHTNIAEDRYCAMAKFTQYKTKLVEAFCKEHSLQFKGVI